MVRPKARSGVSGAASAVADDGASARQRGAVRVGFEGGGGSDSGGVVGGGDRWRWWR